MKNLIAVGIVGTLLLLNQSAASAQQQSRAQQKCINTLNKGMASVAGAQAKANAKCISGYAKAKNNDASTCLFTATKVDTAQTRVCTNETKRCGALPDFGYTGCNTVNNVAELFTASLASDMFGSGINGGILTVAADKAGYRCQTRVVKAVNKLYATHIKQFNRCKKAGLKAKTSPITGTAMLNSCVFADPKMKITKAQVKLLTGIQKKCATTTDPLPGGVCSGLNDSGLSFCLEKRVRCAVCLTTRASDGLTIDCDDFDDDVANGSCFDDL